MRSTLHLQKAVNLHLEIGVMRNPSAMELRFERRPEQLHVNLGRTCQGRVMVKIFGRESADQGAKTGSGSGAGRGVM